MSEAEGQIVLQSKTLRSVEPNAKGLESLLSILEQHEAPFHVGSPVYTMIPLRDGLICGLNNGDLVHISSSMQHIISKFPTKHDGSVSGLHLLPNNRLVSCSEDTTMKVWDLDDFREIATLKGHTDWVSRGALVDKDRFVSASSDKTLKVWDLNTYKELATLEGHKDEVWGVVATKDGKCVSRGKTNYLIVWDMAKYEMICKLEGHIGAVYVLLLTADGQCISGSIDTTLIVWDLKTYSRSGTFRGHTQCVFCATETSDGLCVSGALDAAVRVWNPKTCVELYKLEGHTHSINRLIVTKEGNCISGDDIGAIRMWDLKERKEIAVFQGHRNDITSLVMTEDGNCFSGSNDETVRLWSLKGRQEIQRKFTERSVQLIAVAPDGKVVCSYTDFTLAVWNFETGELQAELKGHTDKILCITLFANGKCVTGSKDRTLRVWDLNESKEIRELKGHSSPVYCVATWGLKCISGSQDFSIMVWDLESSTEPKELNGHGNTVFCIVVLPKDKCASGGADNVIIIWDLITYTSIAKLEGHTRFVYCMALTDDGKLLSGAWDNTIRLWDLKTHQEIAKLKGHTDQIYTIASCPEGCISGSDDKTVRLWNLKEFKQEAIVKVNDSQPRCLARMTNGTYLCATSSGSVSLFNPKLYQSIREDNCDSFDINQLTIQLSALQKNSLSRLKEGKDVTDCLNSLRFYPFNFTALHICTYNNQYQQLKKLLESIPLNRGYFGSPLTLALDKKVIHSVDTILQFFINRAPTHHDDLCIAMNAINDDLPTLVTFDSRLLLSFFRVLMVSPSTFVEPVFISPRFRIPFTTHLDNRLIDLKAVSTSDEKVDNELVKLSVSLPRWNFTTGSSESVSMLTALAECDDKTILTTDYFRTIIEEKWRTFYTFTLGSTLGYVLLLASLVSVICFESIVSLYAFCVLNTIFITYEIAQMIVTKQGYFLDAWNYVDISRCGFSVYWASILLMGWTIDKYLVLVVAILSFIRGFTYFRSFEKTRVFVAMTLAVVREMHSFLIILAYSVLGFGLFTVILAGNLSISEAWMAGYYMIMGEIGDSRQGTVEWLVFTGATAINIVIMMNLLISILGDAYGKTQETSLENDLHQQLELVLEYESMLFWRRETGKGTVVFTVKGALNTEDKEITQEILQSTLTVDGKVAAVDERVAAMDSKVSEKVALIDGKVGAIDGKVAEIDGKVSAMDKKVAGIDGKVSEIQEQLTSILALLQPRS